MKAILSQQQTFCLVACCV